MADSMLRTTICTLWTTCTGVLRRCGMVSLERTPWSWKQLWKSICQTCLMSSPTCFISLWVTMACTSTNFILVGRNIANFDSLYMDIYFDAPWPRLWVTMACIIPLCIEGENYRQYWWIFLHLCHLYASPCCISWDHDCWIRRNFWESLIQGSG